MSDPGVAMQVDQTTCIGSGYCELLAETVFEIDDDTSVASVIGHGRLTRSDAEAIVDKCPSGAISFTVAGDEEE